MMIFADRAPDFLVGEDGVAHYVTPHDEDRSGDLIDSG
jgi:hypothetical protein